MARRAPATFHESLQTRIASQERTLRVLLRWLFSVAGVMWILAYVFPFITETEHWEFRIHQYQLYLVLLTVWGYQAKRDVRRLQVVSEIATERGIGFLDVDEHHVLAKQQMHTFDVLFRRSNDGSWFPVVFSWLLFGAAVGLIALQFRLLFGAE